MRDRRLGWEWRDDADPAKTTTTTTMMILMVGFVEMFLSLLEQSRT
jgi:hypothetical protein